VGYSFTDRWGVGISLGYVNKKDYISHFGFIPYVRYTAVKWNNVNLFVDGAVEVGFGKIDDDYDSKYAGQKFSGWGVGLRPGVSVNLNPNCSFVAHVGNFGYESNKYEDYKANGMTTLNLDLSDIDFGLYFNF